MEQIIANSMAILPQLSSSFDYAEFFKKYKSVYGRSFAHPVSFLTIYLPNVFQSPVHGEYFYHNPESPRSIDEDIAAISEEKEKRRRKFMRDCMEVAHEFTSKFTPEQFCHAFCRKTGGDFPMHKFFDGCIPELLDSLPGIRKTDKDLYFSSSLVEKNAENRTSEWTRSAAGGSSSLLEERRLAGGREKATEQLQTMDLTATESASRTSRSTSEARTELRDQPQKHFETTGLVSRNELFRGDEETIGVLEGSLYVASGENEDLTQESAQLRMARLLENTVEVMMIPGVGKVLRQVKELSAEEEAERRDEFIRICIDVAHEFTSPFTLKKFSDAFYRKFGCFPINVFFDGSIVDLLDTLPGLRRNNKDLYYVDRSSEVSGEGSAYGDRLEHLEERRLTRRREMATRQLETTDSPDFTSSARTSESSTEEEEGETREESEEAPGSIGDDFGGYEVLEDESNEKAEETLSRATPTSLLEKIMKVVTSPEKAKMLVEEVKHTVAAVSEEKATGQPEGLIEQEPIVVPGEDINGNAMEQESEGGDEPKITGQQEKPSDEEIEGTATEVTAKVVEEQETTSLATEQEENAAATRKRNSPASIFRQVPRKRRSLKATGQKEAKM